MDEVEIILPLLREYEFSSPDDPTNGVNDVVLLIHATVSRIGIANYHVSIRVGLPELCNGESHALETQ